MSAELVVHHDPVTDQPVQDGLVQDEVQLRWRIFGEALLAGHPQRDNALDLSRTHHARVDRSDQCPGVVGGLQQAAQQLALEIPEPDQPAPSPAAIVDDSAQRCSYASSSAT